VAPGEFFGAPGHIRVGFAQLPGQLEEGLERLTEGLKADGRGRSPPAQGVILN